MNTAVFWVVLGIAVIFAIWIFVGSKKRTWYKVYLANNDVLLLYRDLNERWWRTSDRYMRFKKESGEEITFPSNAHWVLFWEEVTKGQLSLAREEIQRIKENAAKERV